MFEGNEDIKVEVRSLVELMWAEVGTDVVSCDEIFYVSQEFVSEVMRRGGR